MRRVAVVVTAVGLILVGDMTADGYSTSFA